MESLDQISNDFNEQIDKLKDEFQTKAINTTNDKLANSFMNVANKYEFARQVFNQFFEDGTVNIENN